MTLLIDVSCCCEEHTNEALETLFSKAATNPPDDGIWLPVESPFISRLVELFTARGLSRLEAFRIDLQKWAAGARHTAGERIPRPPGAMERWTDDERNLVRIYLQHLPPAEWTIDDHMMLVDYLVQRYLPPDELETEAKWLASRASVMGRVQANMDGLTAPQADALLAAMSQTVPVFAQNFAQSAAMQFATARAAENVRHFSEGARHSMRAIIAQHVQDQTFGAPGPGHSLETKLLDAFGTLNRDWRRIAVTEAGEAQTAGYVASLPEGTKVKRVEQYAGACAFCRKIDGRIMEVVSPNAADKDPETQIWMGKTNIGRSASPRKRVGGALVERSPDEMWQIPVGLAHPSCRGRWVPQAQDRPGDDPDFGDWMRSVLAAKSHNLDETK